MKPSGTEAAPPFTTPGAGAIAQRTYSLHIRMLDGVDGGNTGVMVLHDGRISRRRRVLRLHGFLHCCDTADGKARSSITSTPPSKGERPVFGGHEVGIGFSGTYGDKGA